MCGPGRSVRFLIEIELLNTARVARVMYNPNLPQRGSYSHICFVSAHLMVFLVSIICVLL